MSPNQSITSNYELWMNLSQPCCRFPLCTPPKQWYQKWIMGDLWGGIVQGNMPKTITKETVGIDPSRERKRELRRGIRPKGTQFTAKRIYQGREANRCCWIWLFTKPSCFREGIGRTLWTRKWAREIRKEHDWHSGLFAVYFQAVSVLITMDGQFPRKYRSILSYLFKI